MKKNYSNSASILLDKFQSTKAMSFRILFLMIILYSNTLQAQIALRGTATTNTSTNTNITINKPAGVIAGDMMLVNIAKGGNRTTNPSLSGWTLIDGRSLAGGTERHGAVLYKIATGTEPVNYTFALGAGTNSASGGIVAFSGVDNTTPFDVTPGIISVQGNQTGVVATSITTATANTAIIMFSQAAGDNPTWNTASWNTTNPGALTELFDVGQGSNDQSSAGAAWAAKPTIGATGNGAATLSFAERNGGILLALRTACTSSVVPTSITGTTTICNGSSTTLTVNGGTVGSGASIQWFTGSCGGTNAGTGNSITVSPSTTTTYFVRYSGSCSTTSCVSTTVTVNSISVAPTSITGVTSVCAGNSTTLTLSGGTSGTGAVAQWFSGGCGGTSVGTGISITVSPVSTTTYFVRYSGTCNTTACTSVSVTVGSPSLAPTSITGTSTICSGFPSTLTVNGGTIGVGATVEWFSNSCGGTPEGTGNSITASPVATTTYFVRYSGICNTTTCTSLIVNVNPVPIITTQPTNPLAVCAGLETRNVIVVATGATSYQWRRNGVSLTNTGIYSGVTSATLTVTNPPIGENGVAYSVLIGNGTGCTVTSSAAIFTVRAIPAPLIEFTEGLGNTVVNIAACGTIAGGGQNDIDIVAGTNPGGSATFQWQVSTDGGGTWTNGPGPTSTTTEYVLNPIYLPYQTVPGVYLFRLIITNNGCSGISNTATMNVSGVSNLISGVIGASQSSCAAIFNPVLFTQTTAPSGGTGIYTYQWVSSTDNISFSIIPGAIAATYDSPAITQTTYYKRIVVSGGCSSTSNTITVSFGNTTITSAATATSVCFSNAIQTTPLNYSATIGSPTTYSIVWNALPANSFIALTNAALPTSPISISVPANTPAGTYTGTLTVSNGICISPNRTFTITVNPLPFTPTISASGPTTFCSGGNVTLTSSAGTTYLWSTGETTPNIVSNSNGSYTVRVINVNGCQSNFSLATNVAVNTISPAIITGDQSLLCGNIDPTAFTTSTAATGNGALTYQWQSNTTGCSGSWSSIALATNSNYDSPNIIQTSYFRLMSTSTLNGVSCSATSNCLNVVINSKVWTGAIDANWTENSNWFPSGTPIITDCVVIPNVVIDPIISGSNYNATVDKLTILNGGNLSVNTSNSITITDFVNVNTGGQFLIKDSASLVQLNNTPNVGNINIERITQPMYRFDYTYWGSPVTLSSGFTLGMLSPDTLADKYFSWIPTVANSFGSWFFESAATVMNPIKGYIVRAPQTFSFTPDVKVPYTANFIGTPNNGDISCPIYFGGLPLANNNDKYNLLGNPYASAVDAELFLSDPANIPIIDGTIYFWTHNSPPNATNIDPFYGDFIINYAANDYASWNRLGGTGTTAAAGSGGAVPTGFIASGQGFFTKSTGIATSGDPVVFKNSMRVNFNNDQFFRNAIVDANNSRTNQEVNEKHRLWLNLVNNGGSFNQILVGYAEGASNNYDRDFDGVRFTDNNTITFYSTLPDKNLVIQGRALPFSDQDQVPLGYKSTVNDTFSIRIDHFDGLFENQNVYIEDRLLNIIHDLKLSPYVFTSAIGVFDDRFILRFTTNELLSQSEFEVSSSLVSSINDEKLFVVSSEFMTQIDIYDISGKQVKRFELVQPDKKFTNHISLAEGIYVLKVKLKNGVVMSRKLINKK